MPGNFSINAEDLRLSTTPSLEVSAGGLQVKLDGANHLERVAGGLRLATTAVDVNSGLQGGGVAALSLKLSDRMEFASGALRSKVKPSEGLGSDASGYFVDKTQGFSWGGLHAFSTVPTVSADPVAANEVARKGYVDAQINVAKYNFDYKDSVRVATATTLPAYTRVGNVLTANANGSLNNTGIDGVTDLVGGAEGTGQRVLLKNGAAGADNGLYYISALGSAGTPWTMTRVSDADASAEVSSGLCVYVEEGTTNQQSKFVLSTTGAITLNTTALTFVRFESNSVGAGAGLTKNGDTIDLVATDSSLTIGTDSVAVNPGEGIEVNSGIRVKLDTNPALARGAGGIKVLEDPNGGLLRDGNGIGVKIHTDSSGKLEKTGTGLRVLAGGAGRSTKWLTVDTLASAFTFASGISSKTGFTAPDTHANSIEGQELFKGGIAIMKRVSSTPSANGEWRFNDTTLEIYGDVTQSGDTYRVKYLQAV